MTSQVTVNLFDVSWTEKKTQKLSDTLHEFAGLDLADRWRLDTRLDRVEFAAKDLVVKEDAYHLDFAKSRAIGPGRLAHKEAISDIRLSQEEFFGEETAALYLPARKWLLILHNQYGVGPSRIASYLNALDPGNEERHFDYKIDPKIDSTALKRMRAMKHFSALEVTANVGAFEEANDELGESVKEVAKEAKAMRLHLRLEANEVRRRGNHLEKGKIGDLIRTMLRNDANDVHKLEVKGGENADQRDQVINLLKHKLKQRFPIGQLDVVNHRYTFASKIRLLRSACRGWMNSLG